MHGGGKRRHYYIRMTGIAYIVVAALASAMWCLPPPCGACLRHVVLASAMWRLPPPYGACLRHVALASAMLPCLRHVVLTENGPESPCDLSRG